MLVKSLVKDSKMLPLLGRSCFWLLLSYIDRFAKIQQKYCFSKNISLSPCWLWFTYVNSWVLLKVLQLSSNCRSCFKEFCQRILLTANELRVCLYEVRHHRGISYLIEMSAEKWWISISVNLIVYIRMNSDTVYE